MTDSPWKCDICRKTYAIQHAHDTDNKPAVDCMLACLPREVFQQKFPGHNPKKGRNTRICKTCNMLAIARNK